ncbi:Major facilitator superfamily [Dillenia turbinata]|uniref:Major facilitator superfamily n=1 Tax=Dillenia turbinata TaxID=194707 RepID=A0AAN8VMP3_9MAGN
MKEERNPMLGDREECPGCKVERIKRQQPALLSTSLFPFIYFMVRDFHIAKREEDIGYFAGYIGSSFMVGRALTSIFWGLLADRYGRKPIILIGTLSMVLFNTLFGLSTSFWMAISMRFLLGCFNSLLGTIRAYASEVCRDEHRALAMSMVSTSRGIGLVIGPAIGGFLAQVVYNGYGVKSKVKGDDF